MARDSICSPFGALLDEIREEKVRHADRPRLEQRLLLSTRPEPELHIEAGVVSGASGRQGSPRSWRWAVAIVLHAVFIAAVLLVPLVMPQDLPSLATGNRAFFVQSLVAPPPPPPPAAPAALRTVARKEAPAAQTTRPMVPAVAPQTEPVDVIDSAPPPVPALSADDGVPGGVEEGVPGGIVGGILEPAVQADEPYRPRTHVRAGIDVKEPRKLKNVAPVYPDVAARGKIEGVVLLEVAIRADGRVEGVRVLRSIPLLDDAAVAAARQWVFSPTLLSGVPVGVTMTVSVRFSLTQQASTY